MCVYQIKEIHWTELTNRASENLPASQAHLHTILLIPTNSSIVCVSLPHSLVTLQPKPTSTTLCLILKKFCFQDAKFSFPASLIHLFYLSVSLCLSLSLTHTHTEASLLSSLFCVTSDYKKRYWCHRTNGSNSSQITLLVR